MHAPAPPHYPDYAWHMPDALVSVRKRPLTGSVFTVLLHGVLIAIQVHQTQQTVSMGEPASRPIYLQILSDGPKRSEKPVAIAEPRIKPPKLPPLSLPPAPNAITVPTVEEKSPTPPPPPEPAATPPTPITPGMDMAEYMAQRRAQRMREQGIEPPPKEDRRAENIRRNLSSGGTSLYEVTQTSFNSVTVRFKPAMEGLGSTPYQSFSVSAKNAEDLRLEIVRNMIMLIQRYYSGDFSFDSQRLGRAVVLSARPRDVAALEAFLLREPLVP